jgi:hypothetical protein
MWGRSPHVRPGGVFACFVGLLVVTASCRAQPSPSAAEPSSALDSTAGDARLGGDSPRDAGAARACLPLTGCHSWVGCVLVDVLSESRVRYVTNPSFQDFVGKEATAARVSWKVDGGMDGARAVMLGLPCTATPLEQAPLDFVCRDAPDGSCRRDPEISVTPQRASDAEQIQRVLSESSRTRSCRAVSPGDAGARVVQVKVVIRGDGRVSSATAVHSNASEAATACVLAKVRALTFPLGHAAEIVAPYEL